MVHLKKCPYCGSTKLIYDNQRGIVVCASCGSVIEEHLIEDNYMGKTQKNDARKIRGFINREDYLILTNLIGKQPPKIESSYTIANYAREKALSYSKSNSIPLDKISKIIEEQIPLIKTRRQHVKLALSIYLIERLDGASKSNALKTASKYTGANIRTLQKLLHRYRHYIYDLEERVATIWKKTYTLSKNTLEIQQQ